MVAAESRKRGAIVLGGAYGCLAVIRSLGRQGIPTMFLNHDHPIPKYSRYTTYCCNWPGAGSRHAADFLLNLSSMYHLEGWILIAGGDAEARLISENHERLSKVFRVPSMPWDRLKWAYDKQLMYAHAGQLGIAHPRLVSAREIDDIDALEALLPLVIKPSVRDGDNRLVRDKAWKAKTVQDLRLLYAEAVELMGKDKVIVQQMIPGDGGSQFSYAAVWRDGAPVASLVARRTRQFPREFGYTSTFVEVIELPEIENAASKFLRSLNYTGLVEIEFKHDRRDNQYKLLDINTRAWAWLGIGAIAGTDFPALLWRQEDGEEVILARGRAGVSWMHFSRDLVSALLDIASGRLKFASYLKSFSPPPDFAAFALDDPLPGLVDLPLLVPRLLRRFSGKDVFNRRIGFFLTLTK